MPDQVAPWDTLGRHPALPPEPRPMREGVTQEVLTQMVEAAHAARPGLPLRGLLLDAGGDDGLAVAFYHDRWAARC